MTKIFNRARKAMNTLRDFLSSTENDFLLVSYPKSGNTWVRYFLCNLISLNEWDGKEVSFSLLNDTMPEFAGGHLGQNWLHKKTIPRVIKTHYRYHFIFHKINKILVLRDPRDVMCSRFEYITNNNLYRYNGSFTDFIRDSQFGLEPWFKFTKSWVHESNYLIYYEDMLMYDIREFKKLLLFLNVNLPEDLVLLATEKSRFKNFRTIENKYGHSNANEFKNGFHFLRKGIMGEWKERFSREDLAYYNLLKKKYNIDLYS